MQEALPKIAGAADTDAHAVLFAVSSGIEWLSSDGEGWAHIQVQPLNPDVSQQQQVFGIGSNNLPNPFVTASLYVGDLEPRVTNGQIYVLFKQIDPVLSVRICRDLITKSSLGFANVIYDNIENDPQKMMVVETMRRARGGSGGHESKPQALKETNFRGVRKLPWGRFAVEISDKDLPDLAIEKAEKLMLWPYPENCMGSRPLSDSFQIQISQQSCRFIMQWVSPSDLVQELKLNLERRMGIPSSLL